MVDFKRLQGAEKPGTIVEIIRRNRSVTWEMIPTEMLNAPEVWSELLKNMPLTAMIRNLGRMSKLGILGPNSEGELKVLDTLEAQIAKSRVHPMQVLLALETYRSGMGFRGSGYWQVNQNIVEGLEKAFEAAFKNVNPTNKRYLVGIDVSGSMHSPIMDSNISAITAVVAMAKVIAETEKFATTMAFTGGFIPFRVKGRSLSDAVDQSGRIGMDRTDCAQPMIYALQQRIPVDVFVVLTDNETWAGRMHPMEALKQYRQQMGIDAKLVVVGVSSTGFTIADPQDPGTLDVVGFDANMMQVMSEFALGNI